MSAQKYSSFRALKTGALSGTIALLLSPEIRALDIQFDFSFDTDGFFTSNPERVDVLNAAAVVFESRFNDQLTAITPGGINTWTAQFTHPFTGGPAEVLDLTIPANVIVVYAGAQALETGTLGFGGPGGFDAFGDGAFLDTVELRGQLRGGDDPPTDFGPWGGSITFNRDTSWYFDPDPTTIENFGSLADFYSVAVHELAHLLGFGTAESWDTWVSGSTFTGPASLALNGGLPVPLHGDLAHWANGTDSFVTSPVVILDQETAMDPSIFFGTRKFFTELDYAGMSDTGWEVIPEPGTVGLLLTGAGWVLARRRRVAITTG